MINLRIMAETISSYIIKKFSEDKGIFRFVFPSYSPELLLAIGKEVEDAILGMNDRKIEFEYGIAYGLGKEWLESGNPEKQNAFKRICDKNWYNEGDNLTSLRNKLKSEGYDSLVILLAGYDHIDDKSSLQDFFHLNQVSVWQNCLGKSFETWIVKAVKEYCNPDGSDSSIAKINDVLKSLFEYGLSDLVGISTYLENIDFSTDLTVGKAYRTILKNLQPFILPNMIGLAGRFTKKLFHRYITPSQAFFNYSMFLDRRKKSSCLKNLDKYAKEISEEELSSDALGEYESIKALLVDLEKYIENYSEELLEKLSKADFIYIHDRILNFKSKKRGPVSTQKSIKKLRGIPPEVFLRAIWLSIGDYRKKLKKDMNLILGDIERISLIGLEFKYSLEAEDDKEEHILDENQLAQTFLYKVLGGLDNFLEEKIGGQIFTEGVKGDTVDLVSKLLPNVKGENFSYKKAGKSEPAFMFKVVLETKTYGSLWRKYTWQLPENHQTRLLTSLYDWVLEKFAESANALPVFLMPYLPEIFMAKDLEEVNRLMSLSLKKDESDMLDLLKYLRPQERKKINDIYISDLSIGYQKFLSEFKVKGFFFAMNNYADLKKHVQATFRKFTENNANQMFGRLLLKSFLIVPLQKDMDSESWIWQDNLENAIVSPLHPSVLEMLYFQHAYLCESFCYLVNLGIKTGDDRSFHLRRWDRVVDHSTIKWPIPGILTKGNILNTNVRSFNYFHLIGDGGRSSDFLTQRLLFEYDETDEEDIADSDLFRETQTSLLIHQVLDDYRELYPFAKDGVSVGAFCGKEIQPIIAGIDSYLKKYLDSKDYEGQNYALHLTVFSDSSDDSSMLPWINAWKDLWQAAELPGGKKHYKQCDIVVSHKIISFSEGYDKFETLLKKMDLDIMIFSEFMASSESDFRAMKTKRKFQSDYANSFPISEKICCSITGGGRDQKRERVLSNPRFNLGSLYTEIMARVRLGSRGAKDRHIVISQSDFSPWLSLVDIAHKNSSWVVCIDPSIDKKQLERVVDGVKKREIISVGTGVGPHGENNYTISTEKFSLGDIKKRVSAYISSILGPWPKEDCERVAEELMKGANDIAGGLSLVKATGPERHIRELIANSLVRKLLPKDESLFCDVLISLDGFLHWFESGNKRPDLLRLKARIENETLNINAQLIECKLAQESEGYLEEARMQLESGLRQLVKVFKPGDLSRPYGVDYRDSPDQRYWWLQLHRLIASKAETSITNYDYALDALEKLSDGHFKISWEAAVVAIWTDSSEAELTSEPIWDFAFEDGQQMNISVANAGKEFIRSVCLEGCSGDIFNQEASTLVFGEEHLNKTQDIGLVIEEEKEQETGELKIDVELKTSNIENNKPEIVIPEPIAYESKRIFLGRGTGGGRDVYWEFSHPDLNNRHMLVFGASGTGKTYTIQALILELSKMKQNSLIVDYTSGFASQQLEEVTKTILNPKQHVILREPLKINPFRRRMEHIEGVDMLERSATTAQRVAGVFAETYQFGDQQKATLYNAIKNGIEMHGDGLNLTRLINILEEKKDEGGREGTHASSVISKIQPFVDMKPFDVEEDASWENIFSDTSSRCHIIQLLGFAKDMGQLITEFSLYDLYRYYRGAGSKENPKVIVLDEIQNLDHSLESPIAQFLTEGRKFGISLILATQTLSNLSKDERDRLFQASHKLFFKPAATEIRSFAKILADSTNDNENEWVGRLNSLKKGQCYSLGPAYNPVTKTLEPTLAFKIKISSLEERVD